MGSTQRAPGGVMGADNLQPPESIDTVREQADLARAMRNRTLLRVQRGELTWVNVINAATRTAGKPLRRIRLRELMRASFPTMAPQVVASRWRAFRARANVPERMTDNEVTVAWLLSSRGPAPGRRLSEYADMMQLTHAERALRVTGFPFRAPASMQKVWH